MDLSPSSQKRTYYGADFWLTTYRTGWRLCEGSTAVMELDYMQKIKHGEPFIA